MMLRLPCPAMIYYLIFSALIVAEGPIIRLTVAPFEQTSLT